MSAVFIDSTTGELKYQGTSGTPAVLAEGDGAVHLVPFKLAVQGLGGIASADTSSYESVGNFLFDPSTIFDGNSKITRSISFKALIYASSGVTARIQLYNVTDGAAVAGTELSSTASSPESVSASLVVGSAIPNGSRLYEIQLKISFPLTPSAGDFAFCSWAGLEVSYT